MGKTAKMVRFMGVGLLVTGMVLPLRAQDAGSPLALSIRVESAYDDNRDGAESGKESNIDTKVQPRIAFTYDLGQSYLSLFYMPYVQWRSDARDDQNDTEIYHELGVESRQELTQALTLRMSNRLSVTDDPRVTEGGVAVRESATHTLNRLDLSLGIDVDPATEIRLGGSSSIKRYDKRSWSNYDEDKFGANLTATRQLGMQINGLAALRYTKSEFYGDTDRGAEFVFAGLGVERVFSPNLAAIVHAGWNSASYNELSGSKGLPAGSARVIMSPSPDTSLTLSARYELADSDWDAYTTQERTSFSARLDHRLTPRLTTGAAVMFANGEYKSKTALSDDVGNGSDDLIAAQINAVYALRQNLSLEAGYQVEDWDSDIRDSFTRNKVMLAVKASL